MARNYLKGTVGDEMYAIIAGATFNFRRLLRVIDQEIFFSIHKRIASTNALPRPSSSLPGLPYPKTSIPRFKFFILFSLAVNKLIVFIIQRYFKRHFPKCMSSTTQARVVSTYCNLNSIHHRLCYNSMIVHLLFCNHVNNFIQ